MSVYSEMSMEFLIPQCVNTMLIQFLESHCAKTEPLEMLAVNSFR